ncbi:hypothetical protein [Megalodesulfovibrio paquesii]
MRAGLHPFGPNSFGHEDPWRSSQQGQQERREAFRRSHRPGDRVRARFLEWELAPADAESPGLAWVLVDGHPLRAPLKGAFEQGDRFLLQVDALTPDILLSPVESAPDVAAEGHSGEADDPALRPRLHITV